MLDILLRRNGCRVYHVMLSPLGRACMQRNMLCKAAAFSGAYVTRLAYTVSCWLSLQRLQLSGHGCLKLEDYLTRVLFTDALA